ncbi:MAG: hypothetical protein AAGK32_21510, partial [Actinomycetota bacterium]
TITRRTCGALVASLLAFSAPLGAQGLPFGLTFWKPTKTKHTPATTAIIPDIAGYVFITVTGNTGSVETGAISQPWYATPWTYSNSKELRSERYREWMCCPPEGWVGYVIDSCEISGGGFGRATNKCSLASALEMVFESSIRSQPARQVYSLQIQCGGAPAASLSFGGAYGQVTIPLLAGASCTASIPVSTSTFGPVGKRTNLYHHKFFSSGQGSYVVGRGIFTGSRGYSYLEGETEATFVLSALPIAK